MAAAYTVNDGITDDESYGRSFEWKMADGSAFPWADYSYEYVVSRRGSSDLSLTVDNGGIVIDEDNDLLTVAAPIAQRLCAGTYQHGLRITRTSTGRVIQIFDGTLTVTEGNFHG